MRNGISRHSTGSACGAINYLIAPTFTHDLGHRKERLVRTPPPETLRGDPAVVGAFIDSLKTKHTYFCSTLSFARSDIDLVAWQAGDATLRAQIDAAIDLWKDVAFAGIAQRCRPPILANTHLHTGRLEVNILAPRAIVRHIGNEFIPRSHNPRPPIGAQRNVWTHYQDALNHTFGWADPGDPQRATRVSCADWVMKRAAVLQRWIDSHQNPDIEAYLLAEPAQVAIFHAAHTFSETNTHDRDALLRNLDPVLKRLDWTIENVKPDSIILRDRTGEQIFLLEGTFCAEHRVEPTRADIAARKAVLAQAPGKLDDAMTKCASYNERILGPDTASPPAPDMLNIRNRMVRKKHRTMAQMLRDTAMAVIALLREKISTARRDAALAEWCQQNSFVERRNLFADIAAELKTLAHSRPDASPLPKPLTDPTEEDFTL